MKLYGNLKSERAEKGQGGNDYLDIKITDDKRQEIASIKIIPGEKAKMTISVNRELVDLEIDKSDFKCDCTEPLCAKCLLVNCKDTSCKTHPEDKKKEFREMYKKR